MARKNVACAASRSAAAMFLPRARHNCSMQVAHHRALWRDARTRSAWTSTPIELGVLGIAAAEATAFQRIAARLLYPSVAGATAEVQEIDPGSQPLLWTMGVSGDRPIVLTTIPLAEGAAAFVAELQAADLRPGALDSGACIQTIVARARVLMRVMEGDTIELWVRNSLAAYTARWLVDAAAD